jgi:hypothetical protein
MHQRLIVVIFIIGLGWIWQPVSSVQAAQRCFGETGYCIDGRIREFWEQNGGLPVFGFPIAPQEQVTIEGRAITVQRFERNRIELHPNNQRPYDVQLGRLGVDRLQQQGRDWFGFAKSGNTSGCRVFAETGHAVCGQILRAWRSNGLQLDSNRAISEAESLALFGLPISGVQTETLSDGKQYQVQWFERARFELHPENAAPYDVLLGLLGNETANTAQVPLSNEPRTPLTTRLFADNIGESAGVTRHFDWQTSWRVNPLYGNNLDSSSATIDGSLPQNVVQIVTKNTYAFNKYYDRHDIFVTITEYATTQEAINTYNNVKYTDIYPTETKWNESDYGGCSHKASVETINRYYIGTAGVLRCANRIAVIRVEEASVDMTQSIMVDIYGNIWFGLTDLLK